MHHASLGLRTGRASKINVLHVIPAYYPATSWGGPIQSVFGLCTELPAVHGADLELKVLTTDSAGPGAQGVLKVNQCPVRMDAGYDVFYCRRRAGNTFSPGLLLKLWSMVRWADAVHLTGVYSSPTIPTLFACRLLRKPVVWSPRGALQDWQGNTRPLLKRAWDWICNLSIKKGKCILHVTSRQEAGESLRRIPKAHAVVIPNGVAIPNLVPVRKWRPNGRLRLLFVGRLHPKKGIENLLAALGMLADDSVSLTLCGAGEPGYVDGLKAVIFQNGLEGKVALPGHVDGEELTAQFLEADVCMVPSFTENFGMVVAEALAHGVPVIASTGTPWAELEKRACGIWTDNSPQSLAQAITRIRGMDLEQMGRGGREWMQLAFSWKHIAVSMYKVYVQATADELDGCSV